MNCCYNFPIVLRRIVAVSTIAFFLAGFVSVSSVEAQTPRKTWSLPRATPTSQQVLGEDTEATKASDFGVPAKPTATPAATSEATIKARVHLLYNEKLKGYEMTLKWQDPEKDENDGYSLAISRTSGVEPSNRVATRSAEWRLRSISPGVWYISMKPVKGNAWGETVHWKFTVPGLPGTETPTPEPTIPASDMGDVKAVRSSLENIWNKLNKDAPKPTEEPMRDYTCNCAKNCKQIESCSEAYFQMFSCGCTELDSNNDGLPCENKCR